jgi:hypothetical protein
MVKGDILDAEFRKIVLVINEHTSNAGKYCECKQCYKNRVKLTKLGNLMQNIGYQRKPMF